MLKLLIPILLAAFAFGCNSYSKAVKSEAIPLRSNGGNIETEFTEAKKIASAQFHVAVDGTVPDVRCCFLSVQEIILPEISERRTEADGNEYVFTEQAKQQILNEIQADLKRQYELSYKVAGSLIADELSEVHTTTVTTTTTFDGIPPTTTVTKTRHLGKGQKELDKANANIEIKSKIASKRIDDLILLAEINSSGRAVKYPQKSEKMVRAFFSMMHKAALQDAASVYGLPTVSKF